MAISGQPIVICSVQASYQTKLDFLHQADSRQPWGIYGEDFPHLVTCRLEDPQSQLGETQFKLKRGTGSRPLESKQPFVNLKLGSLNDTYRSPQTEQRGRPYGIA